MGPGRMPEQDIKRVAVSMKHYVMWLLPKREYKVCVFSRDRRRHPGFKAYHELLVGGRADTSINRLSMPGHGLLLWTLVVPRGIRFSVPPSEATQVKVSLPEKPAS